MPGQRLADGLIWRLLTFPGLFAHLYRVRRFVVAHTLLSAR